MALLQISEPGESPEPHQRRVAFGIDLGTTNSLIAVMRNGSAEVLADAAGRPLLPSALELYRLGWDLAEIAIYISEFRRPHQSTADVDAAWTNLNHYLGSPRTQ